MSLPRKAQPTTWDIAEKLDTLLDLLNVGWEIPEELRPPPGWMVHQSLGGDWRALVLHAETRADGLVIELRTPSGQPLKRLVLAYSGKQLPT